MLMLVFDPLKLPPRAPMTKQEKTVVVFAIGLSVVAALVTIAALVMRYRLHAALE